MTRVYLPLKLKARSALMSAFCMNVWHHFCWWETSLFIPVGSLGGNLPCNIYASPKREVLLLAGTPGFDRYPPLEVEAPHPLPTAFWDTHRSLKAMGPFTQAGSQLWSCKESQLVNHTKHAGEAKNAVLDLWTGKGYFIKSAASVFVTADFFPSRVKIF